MQPLQLLLGEDGGERGAVGEQQALVLLESVASVDPTALLPWELSTLLLALAALSDERAAAAARAHPRFARFAAAALERVPDLPPYDAVATALALQLLQRGSAVGVPGRGGDGSSGAAAPGAAWQALRHRLQTAPTGALDEATVLAVLRAAMEAAADAAAARLAGAQSSRGSSGSSRGSGGEPGAAGAAAGAAAAALPGPRASRDEIAAVISDLPAPVRRRVLEAYQEFVPLHPALESAYPAILHILRTLPHLVAAGAAGASSNNSNSGSGSGSSSRSPYVLLTPGGAGAAAAAAARARAAARDKRQLGRMKRDLCFHARSDELVEPRQLSLNEAIYVLSRRMDLAVDTPADFDALLPQQRVALFLEDETSAHPSDERSGWNSSSSSSGRGSVGSSLQAQPRLPEPPAVALDRLLVDRFSPHARLSQRTLPGAAAAKRAALRRRGWRVARIGSAELRAAAVGAHGRAVRADDRRAAEAAHARVEALLRRALRPSGGAL